MRIPWRAESPREIERATSSPPFDPRKIHAREKASSRERVEQNFPQNKFLIAFARNFHSLSLSLLRVIVRNSEYNEFRNFTRSMAICPFRSVNRK